MKTQAWPGEVNHRNVNLQVVVERTVNPWHIPRVGHGAWNFRGNGVGQGEADK